MLLERKGKPSHREYKYLKCESLADLYKFEDEKPCLGIAAVVQGQQDTTW